MKRPNPHVDSSATGEPGSMKCEQSQQSRSGSHLCATSPPRVAWCCDAGSLAVSCKRAFHIQLASCSAGSFPCVRRLGDGVAERRTTHALILLLPWRPSLRRRMKHDLPVFSSPRASAGSEVLPNPVSQSGPLHGFTRKGFGLSVIVIITVIALCLSGSDDPQNTRAVHSSSLATTIFPTIKGTIAVMAGQLRGKRRFLLWASNFDSSFSWL